MGIILFSAIVAGWQAIERLLDPQPIAFLGWVAAAGVVGFLGNEAVAVFRIRVWRARSPAWRWSPMAATRGSTGSRASP